MDRCVETFPIDRFRSLLGVPPGVYVRGNDFERFVLRYALLEINGLSDMGVDATLVRRHSTAPIEAVTVTWWKKQGEDFSTAIQERNRSKLGRMARLRGAAERVQGVPRRDQIAPAPSRSLPGQRLAAARGPYSPGVGGARPR
jgi:plasmid replication initiation protein